MYAHIRLEKINQPSHVVAFCSSRGVKKTCERSVKHNGNQSTTTRPTKFPTHHVFFFLTVSQFNSVWEHQEFHQGSINIRIRSFDSSLLITLPTSSCKTPPPKARWPPTMLGAVNTSSHDSHQKNLERIGTPLTLALCSQPSCIKNAPTGGANAGVLIAWRAA